MNPRHFQHLSLCERAQYRSLQENLANIFRSSDPRGRWEVALERVREFVRHRYSGDWHRCFVCGVYDFDGGIAINRDQLHYLIPGSKSVIDTMLWSRGYTSVPVSLDVKSGLTVAIPILTKADLGSWSIWTIDSDDFPAPISSSEIPRDLTEDFMPLTDGLPITLESVSVASYWRQGDFIFQPLFRQIPQAVLSPRGWQGNLGAFIAAAGVPLSLSSRILTSTIEFSASGGSLLTFRLILHSQQSGGGIVDFCLRGPASMLDPERFVVLGIRFAQYLCMPKGFFQEKNLVIACVELVIENWSTFLEACALGEFTAFGFQILDQNGNVVTSLVSSEELMIIEW
jgi:hypothetical protein